MKQRTILLADDNLQDELLTLRALRQLNVLNSIDIMRYCCEALVYFFTEKSMPNVTLRNAQHSYCYIINRPNYKWPRSAGTAAHRTEDSSSASDNTESIR